MLTALLLGGCSSDTPDAPRPAPTATGHDYISVRINTEVHTRAENEPVTPFCDKDADNVTAENTVHSLCVCLTDASGNAKCAGYTTEGITASKEYNREYYPITLKLEVGKLEKGATYNVYTFANLDNKTVVDLYTAAMGGTGIDGITYSYGNSVITAVPTDGIPMAVSEPTEIEVPTGDADYSEEENALKIGEESAIELERLWSRLDYYLPQATQNVFPITYGSYEGGEGANDSADPEYGKLQIQPVDITPFNVNTTQYLLPGQAYSTSFGAVTKHSNSFAKAFTTFENETTNSTLPTLNLWAFGPTTSFPNDNMRGTVAYLSEFYHNGTNVVPDFSNTTGFYITARIIGTDKTPGLLGKYLNLNYLENKTEDIDKTHPDIYYYDNGEVQTFPTLSLPEGVTITEGGDWHKLSYNADAQGYLVTYHVLLKHSQTTKDGTTTTEYKSERNNCYGIQIGEVKCLPHKTPNPNSPDINIIIRMPKWSYHLWGEEI